jgi:hypothetical protein
LPFAATVEIDEAGEYGVVIACKDVPPGEEVCILAGGGDRFGVMGLETLLSSTLRKLEGRDVERPGLDERELEPEEEPEAAYGEPIKRSRTRSESPPASLSYNIEIFEMEISPPCS